MTGEDEVSKTVTLRDPKEFFLSLLCLWSMGSVISKEMPWNLSGVAGKRKDVLQCEIAAGVSAHQITTWSMRAFETESVTSPSKSSQSRCFRFGGARVGMYDRGPKLRDTVERDEQGPLAPLRIPAGFYAGFQIRLRGSKSHLLIHRLLVARR